MSKRRNDGRRVSAIEEEVQNDNRATIAKKALWLCVGVTVMLLLTAGVFAKNDWFPSTDAFTGKKVGWFGKQLPKNASSSWNPVAAVLPTPVPQLSKEYVYAGSRLNGGRANKSQIVILDMEISRVFTIGGRIVSRCK